MAPHLRVVEEMELQQEAALTREQKLQPKQGFAIE